MQRTEDQEHRCSALQSSIDACKAELKEVEDALLQAEADKQQLLIAEVQKKVLTFA